MRPLEWYRFNHPLRSSRLQSLLWFYLAKSFLIKGWKTTNLHVCCSALAFLQLSSEGYSPPRLSGSFVLWVVAYALLRHSALPRWWPTGTFCMLISQRSYNMTSTLCCQLLLWNNKEGHGLPLWLFIKGYEYASKDQTTYFVAIDWFTLLLAKNLVGGTRLQIRHCGSCLIPMESKVIEHIYDRYSSRGSKSTSSFLGQSCWLLTLSCVSINGPHSLLELLVSRIKWLC